MWIVRMIVSATLFLGGSVAGHLVAKHLAEESFIAATLGFIMFPLSFIVGMLFWQGVAIISGLLKSIFGNSDKSKSDHRNEIPPGSFMLIPPSVVLPALAGIGIGFVSGETSIWSAVLVCSGAGLVYGLLLFVTARRTLLPMVESWNTGQI